MKNILSILNPTQWAIFAGVSLALVLAVTAVGYKIHAAGFEAGAKSRDVQIETLRKEIAQLQMDRIQLELDLEMQRVAMANAHTIRVTQLVNQLKEAQDANTKIERARRDALALAERRARELRDNRSTSELALGTTKALAVAECNVVRTFAAGAYRTATTCRDAVADLGLGAGGLVEATASAYHEHERAEALMRFVMPDQPSGPFGDRQ